MGPLQGRAEGRRGRATRNSTSRRRRGQATGRRSGTSRSQQIHPSALQSARMHILSWAPDGRISMQPRPPHDSSAGLVSAQEKSHQGFRVGRQDEARTSKRGSRPGRGRVHRAVALSPRGVPLCSGARPVAGSARSASRLASSAESPLKTRVARHRQRGGETEQRSAARNRVHETQTPSAHRLTHARPE